MQILKTALIIIFSLVGNIKLWGQSSDFSLIKNQFENYRNNVLQEKLYVHTDKNFYLAGELLWFKLYNVDAALHQPLDISKVAYIELLDKDHRPVAQTKVSIEEGTGSGSFVLPMELNSGNYTFRAYTNWMKNFEADFYFEKPISVVNAIKNEPLNGSINLQINYAINFFPEGGNLVNGIESTIGFHAMDQYARSYDVHGMVLDQNNDTILNFSSLKFGIGSFRFLPQANKTYRAVVTIN